VYLVTFSTRSRKITKMGPIDSIMNFFGKWLDITSITTTILNGRFPGKPGLAGFSLVSSYTCCRETSGPDISGNQFCAHIPLASEFNPAWLKFPVVLYDWRSQAADIGRSSLRDPWEASPQLWRSWTRGVFRTSNFNNCCGFLVMGTVWNLCPRTPSWI